MEIDVEGLALHREVQLPIPQPVKKVGKDGRFLRGPVPMAWLEEAMRLPGHALHVAIEIWFQAGVRKSTEVSISISRVAAASGCSRATSARGLDALEEAGLVSLNKGSGRKAIVKILHATS